LLLSNEKHAEMEYFNGLTFLHAFAPIGALIMPLAYRLQSLGRPVFTTNIDGAVIWDVGTPTPFGDDASTNAAFGEAVQTAGAFALSSSLAKIDSQDRFLDAHASARRFARVFLGQYQDAKIGTDIVLSHNHHRTYDPTLGRYLQSDPIGLD